MNELSIVRNYIPAMSDMAIEKVRGFEEFSLSLPQVKIDTSHVFHAGMYARTIMIPAGVVLTGALIKIATMLIVQGEVVVYIGDEAIELNGYNILPASANRKQAFVAKADTYLTMIFPTSVKSINEAEEEFTNDFNMLISRKYTETDQVIITGE